MKRFILALFAATCVFGLFGADADAAAPAWKTTLGRVLDLGGDMGIAGFMKKDPPAYITGNYAEKDRVAVNDMVGKDPHDAASGYKTPNGYYSREGKWIGG